MTIFYFFPVFISEGKNFNQKIIFVVEVREIELEKDEWKTKCLKRVAFILLMCAQKSLKTFITYNCLSFLKETVASRTLGITHGNKMTYKNQVEASTIIFSAIILRTQQFFLI